MYHTEKIWGSPCRSLTSVFRKPRHTVGDHLLNKALTGKPLLEPAQFPGQPTPTTPTMTMTLQLFFDANFLRVNENSIEKSELLLLRIFRKLRNLFSHPSLKRRIGLELIGDPIFLHDQVKPKPWTLDISFQLDLIKWRFFCAIE